IARPRRRLVGAAAQEGGTGGGRRARGLLHELLRLRGAGPGHQHQLVAADLHVADADGARLPGLGGGLRIGGGRLEDLLHVREGAQEPERARGDRLLHLHGLAAPVAAQAATREAEARGGADALFSGTLGCGSLERDDQGPTPTKTTSTTAEIPKRRATQPLAVRTASPRAPR